MINCYRVIIYLRHEFYYTKSTFHIKASQLKHVVTTAVPVLPCGLVGSKLFGRRGWDPGIPPGGWEKTRAWKAIKKLARIVAKQMSWWVQVVIISVKWQSNQYLIWHSERGARSTWIPWWHEGLTREMERGGKEGSWTGNVVKRETEKITFSLLINPTALKQ